jgi:hypothetical protein
MSLKHDEFLEMLVENVKEGAQIVLETKLFEGITEKKREDGYQATRTGAYYEFKVIKGGKEEIVYQVPLFSDSTQGINQEADDYLQKLQKELLSQGYKIKDKKLIKAECTCPWKCCQLNNKD